MECVKSYFRCMFRALRDIHARGIIHRDVKPANFLFDSRTGIGTLCDFGLACARSFLHWNHSEKLICIVLCSAWNLVQRLALASTLLPHESIPMVGFGLKLSMISSILRRCKGKPGKKVLGHQIKLDILTRIRGKTSVLGIYERII